MIIEILDKNYVGKLPLINEYITLGHEPLDYGILLKVHKRNEVQYLLCNGRRRRFLIITNRVEINADENELVHSMKV